MKKSKAHRFGNLGHDSGESLGGVCLSNHETGAPSLLGTPFGARTRREYKRQRKAAKTARRQKWREALKWSKGRGVLIPTPAAVYRGRAASP